MQTAISNPKIKEQQRLYLAVLWELYDFNKSEMGRAVGVNPQVVTNWFARGRVSATCAIKYGRIEKVKKAGVTKELLRPDVDDWMVD